MKMKKMLTMLVSVMMIMCLWNMTANAEDGGINYAPYYDAETETIHGIEVGDEVGIGTVFSGNNLEEGQMLAFGYKAYDGDVIFKYSILSDRGLYTVGEEDGNFDPADGWVVADVRYDEDDDMIEIDMVSKVPPVQINPINISVDWSKFEDFKVGETVPETVEGINITGEGVESVWAAEVKFEVSRNHIEKGYISEEEFNTAIRENSGWWYVSWLDEPFIASSGDVFGVRVEASSEIGYVFAYSQSEQITGNIVLYSGDVVVLNSGACMGDYAGMAAEFNLKLGSIEKISEKVNPVVKLTGWQLIDGKWYFYDNDGKKVTNQWKKDSKGWCFLGEDGAMLTNQWVKDSVGYCFVDKSGYMVYNKWCLDETGWAFAGADGYRQTNKWIKDSVGWCYVGTDGYMVCNDWVADSKDYVYLGESGYMVTNKWIETENGWCYVGADGYKVKNQWVKDSAGWCYLDKNGYMVCSQWVKDSIGWCYLDENGRMVYDGWVADSKGLCYLDKNGYMATNKWVLDNDQWCYVGADGYKVTNKWVKDSKGWCYLDQDGYMVYNQWVKDSVGWCYVDNSGYMVYSKWIQDGSEWYYINSSGYMATGWVKDGGSWYYLKSNGVMAANEWVENQYWVDASGKWVQGVYKWTAGLNKLKQYILNSGDYNAYGESLINHVMYYDGIEYTMGIAYNASSDTLRFGLVAESDGIESALEFYVNEMGNVNLNPVVAVLIEPAAYTASTIINPMTYTGNEDVYFTVSNSFGFGESDVQELSNALLRLGFAGWEALVMDAGVTMNDIGFVAYNPN